MDATLRPPRAAEEAMVRGERVGGFVVTELLGSGRSGLLYRLEHGTSGQSAVLRTIVAGDDESSTRFSEEGRRFLPAGRAPRLVRAQLGDGTPVELLLSRGLRGSNPLRLRRGAGALAAGLVAVGVAAALSAPAPLSPVSAPALTKNTLATRSSSRPLCSSATMVLSSARSPRHAPA